MKEKISAFLGEQYGHYERIEPLATGGSGRAYYRLFYSKGAPCKTLILAENNNHWENQVFINFSKKLMNIGLCVPTIYAHDGGGLYLQEDLGNRDLLSIAIENHADKKRLYKQTLQKLIDFQIKGATLFAPQEFYSYRNFDKELIYRDLFYFKHYFLDFSNIKYPEHLLLRDFRLLAQTAEASPYQYLMYRDLQGRNIMVHKDKPYFIDYQGAMKGPLLYDLVSLLWQAKANLSNTFRQELYAEYMQNLSKALPDFNRERLQQDFEVCLILRLLQVLGAYGKLGWIEKKSHFLESITYGVRNLKDLIPLTLIKKIPSLKNIIIALQDKEYG